MKILCSAADAHNNIKNYRDVGNLVQKIRYNNGNSENHTCIEMTIPDINGENLEAQSQKECWRFEIGPIKKGVKTSPILFRFF